MLKIRETNIFVVKGLTYSNNASLPLTYLQSKKYMWQGSIRIRIKCVQSTFLLYRIIKMSISNLCMPTLLFIPGVMTPDPPIRNEPPGVMVPAAPSFRAGIRKGEGSRDLHSSQSDILYYKFREGSCDLHSSLSDILSYKFRDGSCDLLSSQSDIL